MRVLGEVKELTAFEKELENKFKKQLKEKVEFKMGLKLGNFEMEKTNKKEKVEFKMGKLINVLFVLFLVGALVASVVMASGDAVGVIDFLEKQIIAFVGLIFMPVILFFVSKA